MVKLIVTCFSAYLKLPISQMKNINFLSVDPCVSTAHQRSTLNDVEMGEPSSSIPSSTASPRPGASSQLEEAQNGAELLSTGAVVLLQLALTN